MYEESILFFTDLFQNDRPVLNILDADYTFLNEDLAKHYGMGLYGFPGSVCVSVNEEVVHGIPSAKRVLIDGDIVTVDVGVRLDGWCSDSAWTFPVGNASREATALLEITERALEAAVDAAVPGNHVGDIGAAVIRTVEGTRYGIIRELVGHGIGQDVHEDPQVPNVGRAGHGPLLREGMVLAIEPMLSAGSPEIRTLRDGWTVVTADRSLSAHFEHTVGITADGPRILTRVGAQMSTARNTAEGA
jgi:methionyl aminopeptidase